MPRILIAWIGKMDLRAPTETDAVGVGPVAQALEAREFEEVYLLSNFDKATTRPYLDWLHARTPARIELVPASLTGPTEFGEIYEAALTAIRRAQGAKSRNAALTFHLSPGTPAMAAVWILLAKTRYPAELIESSREHGVRTASVPFDIAADFIPDLLRQRDERLRNASAAPPPDAPEFADIIHRSRTMSRLIDRAQRVAVRNLPVLIEGESGTGKELLARAIHRASDRHSRPFVAVNCGAIPHELVESELFGHEKGAFTDAKQARKGYFIEADGGTLFLDELGELPAAAQVKLLRTLQEGEVVRLGASKPQKVDVRIIAATNRTLTTEIADGRFREDLFYRIAVAVLKIPPLRERSGDLGVLVDHLLAKVNTDALGTGGGKKLSAGARNLLLSHPWPGNVRELLNTLQRAVLWTDGPTIGAEDMREALLPTAHLATERVLGRPLGPGLDLQALLGDVARHYLKRAMAEAGGNKTKAAELVGLPSYQTLTNWLTRYEVLE